MKQILSLALLLLLLTFPRTARAVDVVTLGVPEFGENINFLTDKSLAATYLRRAGMGRLIEVKPGNTTFELTLADKFNASSDYRSWKFRVPATARFSNGLPVQNLDVIHSLERCQASGGLASGIQIKTEEGSAASQVLDGGRWISLTIQPAVDPRLVQDQLGNCPILERGSSRLFGPELGEGSNFISTGEYRLLDFKAGRELTLVRTSQIHGKQRRQSASTIVVRGFKDSESALTALRVGTIDAFVTGDVTVLKRVHGDETLASFSCGELTQVHRKGLSISCPELFVASSVQYVG
jgi:ABC-type transport system substrate-binding protein